MGAVARTAPIGMSRARLRAGDARTVAAAVPGESALRASRRRQCGRRAGDPLARDAVDRLGRVGEGQLREGDQVAVHVERVQIDIVERVARLVVSGVELLPGRTAPDGLLLWGLRHFGAGKQAARGDAGQDSHGNDPRNIPG